MERKVSEIKNKDHSSRRSSFHKDDLFNLSARGFGGRAGRVGSGRDELNLNHNAFAMGHSADVEEGAKASSSEGLDSSQENLSQSYWSDEEQSNYVIRRRR